MSRFLEAVRDFITSKQPLGFDQYVQYWTEITKNPKAIDVSTETVGSKEWIALAQAEYRLLKWAGLRKDWVLVEIGFGNGKIPYMLEREHAIPDGSYHGFDIIQNDLEYCRGKYPSNNLHFDLIDRNNLTTPNEFADCILLMSVFTHIDKAAVRYYLKQIRKVLKPTGLCIFSIHLSPPGKAGQRTIPIAQYSFDEIRTLVSSMGFYCYKFRNAPDLDSVRYVPGLSPDGPYGMQFVFIVSNKMLTNPELLPI